MREDATAGGDWTTTGRRATVAEAAEALGISVEAVRGRIKRGTIGHEREDDRVFVLLDADQSTTGHGQEDAHVADRSELVALLRDQLEDLRSDRDAWREQARRSDYLLGSAMERTRELEGRLRELDTPREQSVAAEQPEAPETVEEGPEEAEPGSGSQEPPEAIQMPWWRRVFRR